MEKANLERLVRTHLAFSSALEGHMSRLWSRALTSTEKNSIRSYALCGSFMALEALEVELARAASPGEAEASFSFMSSEVEKKSPEVIRLVQQHVGHSAPLPQPNAYPNLLAWEEAILESHNAA